MLVFIMWACDIKDVLSHKTQFDMETSVPFKFVIANPPVGFFGPIEISPSVFPRNPYPVEPLSPMYPTFPNTYDPVLTGRCPTNFSEISSILDKTASDCSAPLARLVGNVICCPQIRSLLHIFQGSYNTASDLIALNKSTANDCFADIVSILTSRGANSAIPEICSVQSVNLTGDECPVKDIVTFEKMVNKSKLLDACSTVDPLKECCHPVCQPAIAEAAMQISLLELTALDNSRIPGVTPAIEALNGCKGVVYSWLSRKLSLKSANTAFRILSSCKVNKACPLDFNDPSQVIKACHNVDTPNHSCCKSLNAYITGIQRQMLITNRQAINCATFFGSMLKKGGVMTNVYELCDVDLKDFSLQAYGQQGCLLRSLPTDVIFDSSTGFSFTCDLSDNIAAPWPSSATFSSLSLCAPEMSLPALPVAKNAGSSGHQTSHLCALLFFFLCLILSSQ